MIMMIKMTDQQIDGGKIGGDCDHEEEDADDEEDDQDDDEENSDENWGQRVLPDEQDYDHGDYGGGDDDEVED